MKISELLNEVISLKTKQVPPEVESFMKEFIGATTQHPFDRQLRLWKDAVGLSLYPHDGRIHFATIMTFAEKNSGTGSKALKWICDLADKHGVAMELEPVLIKNAGSREGKNLTKAQLTAWYKKAGFTKKEYEYLIRPIKS